jgi:hypothetical protein
MKVVSEKLTCKLCGSHNVVHYGHYHNIPRFWCKDCRRKFADNNALPKYKTPIEQVTHALAAFYDGDSLNDIKREINQQYGNPVTDAYGYGHANVKIDRVVGAVDFWISATPFTNCLRSTAAILN